MLAVNSKCFKHLEKQLDPTPTPSVRHVVVDDPEGQRIDNFLLNALRGVPRGVLEHLIQRLDRWQDDEPARSRGVETIFHPIPSVERRLAALGQRATPAVGAWHAARMMLFLSWVGLGLLSRAVHCNSGRPELWAALPAD